MVAKIVVVVGETASGKSDLAMFLAQKFGGEIIAADSRTIYKYMDIGTAKPSKEDQKVVRHHLLDVVEPDQAYSVAMFQSDAKKAIKDITKRGKLPIVVGGSGLYANSIIYDYKFGNTNRQARREFEGMSLSELQKKARDIGITEDDIDFLNHRHLSRAVEAGGVRKEDLVKARPNTLVLGVSQDKNILSDRIEARINTMVDDGLVSETQWLYKKFDPAIDAFRAPAYTAFKKYIDGDVSLDEARLQFAQADRRLAKKQKTWFKRNKSIHWLNNRDEAVDFVTTFLNKTSIAK